MSNPSRSLGKGRPVRARAAWGAVLAAALSFGLVCASALAAENDLRLPVEKGARPDPLGDVLKPRAANGKADHTKTDPAKIDPAKTDGAKPEPGKPAARGEAKKPEPEPAKPAALKPEPKPAAAKPEAKPAAAKVEAKPEPKKAPEAAKSETKKPEPAKAEKKPEAKPEVSKAEPEKKAEAEKKAPAPKPAAAKPAAVKPAAAKKAPAKAEGAEGATQAVVEAPAPAVLAPAQTSKPEAKAAPASKVEPKPEPAPKPVPKPVVDPVAFVMPAGPSGPAESIALPAEGLWVGEVTVEFQHTQIILRAATNDQVERVTYFSLKQPRKLALDLRGNWRKKGGVVVRYDTGPVKNIVAGEHPDRLRLSVEFREGAVKPELDPVILREPGGVIVTIPLAR